MRGFALTLMGVVLLLPLQSLARAEGDTYIHPNYRFRLGRPDETWRLLDQVKVLDFNPVGDPTQPLLFSWEELYPVNGQRPGLQNAAAPTALADGCPDRFSLFRDRAARPV